MKRYLYKLTVLIVVAFAVTSLAARPAPVARPVPAARPASAIGAIIGLYNKAKAVDDKRGLVTACNQITAHVQQPSNVGIPHERLIAEFICLLSAAAMEDTALLYRADGAMKWMRIVVSRQEDAMSQPGAVVASLADTLAQLRISTFEAMVDAAWWSYRDHPSAAIYLLAHAEALAEGIVNDSARSPVAKNKLDDIDIFRRLLHPKCAELLHFEIGLHFYRGKRKADLALGGMPHAAYELSIKACHDAVGRCQRVPSPTCMRGYVVCGRAANHSNVAAAARRFAHFQDGLAWMLPLVISGNGTVAAQRDAAKVLFVNTLPLAASLLTGPSPAVPPNSYQALDPLYEPLVQSHHANLDFDQKLPVAAALAELYVALEGPSSRHAANLCEVGYHTARKRLVDHGGWVHRSGGAGQQGSSIDTDFKAMDYCRTFFTNMPDIGMADAIADLLRNPVTVDVPAPIGPPTDPLPRPASLASELKARLIERMTHEMTAREGFINKYESLLTAAEVGHINADVRNGLGHLASRLGWVRFTAGGAGSSCHIPLDGGGCGDVLMTKLFDRAVSIFARACNEGHATVLERWNHQLSPNYSPSRQQAGALLAACDGRTTWPLYFSFYDDGRVMRVPRLPVHSAINPQTQSQTKGSEREEEDRLDGTYRALANDTLNSWTKGKRSLAWFLDEIPGPEPVFILPLLDGGYTLGRSAVSGYPSCGFRMTPNHRRTVVQAFVEDTTVRCRQLRVDKVAPKTQRK